MPLARIEIPAGRPAGYGRAVADIVYSTMVSALKAPDGDRFQVVTEHTTDGLIIDPHYLGIERSANALIVQLVLNEGRTTAVKQAFYQALADELHERLGLRREDLFVSLVEVKKENWSFGNGIAQYA